MICTQCEAIFGSHYKKCPVCGSKEIEKEKFAPQVEEIEEVEPITAYVEFTPLDDFQG